MFTKRRTQANLNDKITMLKFNLETDGKCLYQIKDPPGQRCVYIIPGNVESKIYRLTTFGKFPNHIPVDVTQLAINGFFFTGYRDRVKCFSCARCVEDWCIGDDPASREWHGRDCSLVAENTRNSAVINTKPSQRTSSIINRNTKAELERQFPCLRPRNPHMRDVFDRLQTFVDSKNWPKERTNSLPQQFAEAGLLYLGNRDRVKCWYCNGGLQNWELNDEPWFEHAKWFPKCEFLLQKKGPGFVETVAGQFPNLQRPPQSAPSFMNFSPTPNPENCEQANTQEAKKVGRERKPANSDIQPSHLIEKARSMGFNDVHIQKVLQKGCKTSALPFENFSEMLDNLLKIPVSSSIETKTTVSETKPHENPISNAFQELQSLERNRLCRNCHDEASSVLFLPCGHLVCCQNCSKNVQKCSLCKTLVKEKIKTFIA